MSNAKQLKAAIERTETALAFIQREIDAHAPNQFGRYPYYHSKEAIKVASKMQNKYNTIHTRLYALLIPKNTSVPARWYSHNLV